MAEALGVSAGDVVVCSTGLIGELLPMAKRAVDDLQKIDAFITEHHDAELATDARYRPR